MKKLVFLTLILCFGFMIGCSSRVTQNTQENTLFLMQSAIDNQDMDEFKELLIDGKKTEYAEKDLKSLKEMGAVGGGYITMYYLCEYPNGKMVLFNITQKKIDGKYYIQDIIPVPDEMQKLFKQKNKK